MNHHAGLLIYQHHIIVLINKVERYIFGDEFEFPWRLGKHDGNCIIGFYLVIGLNIFAVYKYVSSVQGNL